MVKRVAHLCTSKYSYKMLEDKLWLLKQRGYEIHLISSEEGADSGFFRAKGIPQHYIDMNRSISLLKDLKACLALIKLLQKMKFDIVHTHTAKAGFIGRIAAKIARVPLIIHTSHGLPFYQGQKAVEYHIYRILEIVAAKFCDFVGTQNQADFNVLSKYINASKLYYEGNGVNLDFLDTISQSMDEENLLTLKAANGIPAGKKIILVGARFEPVKDHLLLLESLKLLRDFGEENFCCLLLGSGPLEQELKHIVRKLDLGPWIKFLGYQVDIYPWLRLADLIVLSSQKEGIPRIIMESMAFQKAVVATDVVGTRELVLHEQTGLLSPDKDAGQLAANISRLLKNQQLQINFGLAGRKRIESYFSNDQVVARIHNIYRQS